METTQGIVPIVAPSWLEFTSSASNGTYMLTIDYAVNGTLSLNANVTIVFAGGRFTGSGTINGNNTTFVAPPIQIFDSTIQFSGTWKMEKVYAENFGDTNGSNSDIAINKALKFSNISGCIVQLLGKVYTITQTIQILGGTSLEGTIAGPSQPYDSLASQYGTVILASGTVDAINITTTNAIINGVPNPDFIDCYRFSLKNLTIRHTGSGIAVNIEAKTTKVPNNEILAPTPRAGILMNMRIQYTTTGNYGIRVAGGSYIKFDTIYINGGKGILLTDNYLQEFLWFDKVIVNNVDGISFEIKKGSYIYLTEVDTNDSDIGLMINTDGLGIGTFNVFVNRFNSARCGIGIAVNASNVWITRLKISNSTIYQVADQPKTIIAGISLANYAGNYIADSIFENIDIDVIGTPNVNYYAINENWGGTNCLTNCRFINIKTLEKTQLSDNKTQLIVANILQSGVYIASSVNSNQSFQLTNKSPFPNKPVVIVSTNQLIPFSVSTSNTKGGVCSVTVNFANTPLSLPIIYYYLTGYYTS